MQSTAWRASQHDVEALVAARHGDPFALLGPHATPNGTVIRAFVPHADDLRAVDFDGRELGTLDRRHAAGFFEGLLPGVADRPAYRLHARNATGEWSLDDPYRFGPVLGPLDDYYLREGTHRQLYARLGAHAITHEGVDGVHFAVWAPNAERVSVVGDFNAWDGRRHQMRKRTGSGTWEIFAPDLAEGTLYKFEIVGADGALLPLKADPIGFASELRPGTASVVSRTDHFPWTDGAHLEKRAQTDLRRAPVAIYEVHLGSWRRGPGDSFLSWDALADTLVPYAASLGFTHLQFMPVSEHPLDASWGYQPIGLFAPTRRFGDPSGFSRLVDRAHAAGLGVILDWVPAHFPTDAHGLARFDGTHLYEHADPRQGFHPDWNTAIYNFGRIEVSNFLAASALYWLDEFHVDGLRVDAVASMLYLDYSRREGEWLPNAEGGRENKDAVAFLQRVNELAYGLHPGIAMIAEESTAWPGVSAPVYAGGLGFGFKWNMGWMNDTLAYLGREPIHRRWHHDNLTFGLLYAFSENYVLPISHDEVVHGKGSMVGKVPGDAWQKFATVRAYYAFMWGHPGKKLLFMGQEFGQWNEWNSAASLDWHLLDIGHPGGELHWGLRRCVADLNAVYRANPALHARDCEAEGFRWIVADDRDNSVFAWMRFGAAGDPPVAVVVNFTPVPRQHYRIGLPMAGRWQEILNTDAPDYAGSGQGNLGVVQATDHSSHGYPASAEVVVPPLGAVYLRFEGGVSASG